MNDRLGNLHGIGKEGNEYQLLDISVCEGKRIKHIIIAIKTWFDQNLEIVLQHRNLESTSYVSSYQNSYLRKNRITKGMKKSMSAMRFRR